MTEEEINSTSILDLINRDDFNSLFPATVQGKRYWELTFIGKQTIPGGLYRWEGSKSIFQFFKIYKPR